ncbi:hypothetical protein [Alteribacter populi]|uniref:hypothetical protein n=1 Tax=Alteribacter populi TaxID=2011011 RepID=UPI0012FF753D|nr:hypothetical protein [Alteribacter populi]
MKHDVNRIVDNVGKEWSENLANANRKIAILLEENRQLRAENESLTNANREDDE